MVELLSQPGGPMIAVYVVTYRRHQLLRRAIASVLAQTHRNLRLLVVNDDPDDAVVAQILADFTDDRLSLFEPLQKRGATGSFALVFEEAEADFVALLEDDNWWEPEFLASQIGVLDKRPESNVVVGNERIWREESDGSWINTGRTIWSFGDIREHHFTLESICGSAIYCNSSALVRVTMRRAFAVPASIPVDVTEHFRERTFTEPVLLNGAALTNYSETLETARDVTGVRWSHYQQLLIGSCMIALPSAAARRELAQRLWLGVPGPRTPRAVTLVLTGLSIPEASSLLREAPLAALMRAALTVFRRRGMLLRGKINGEMTDALRFLVNAPLTQALVNQAGELVR